ncbi:MAG: ABC-2 family transporter protein [Myxococcales bacterium]|nr:ABC-2 family transporter protein [Myxococcales bacterium]
MRVYALLLAASLKGQMGFRSSFLLETVGRFWLTALELVAVFVMFTHVDGLGGFSQWEVVYLYGVASLALGLAEIATDGMKDMPELVRTGGLDVVFVRPVPALVQVLGRKCRPHHLGRAGQGAVAVVAALWVLQLPVGPLQLFMLTVNVGGCTAIFVGLFIASAATTVFTVQSSEAFSAFTYGGVQMTQFPITIYGRLLRSLFLWIVPLGFTSYFPALVVLGKPDALGFGPLVPFAAPLVAGAFLGVCLAWWSYALGRYQSTGS